MTIAQNMIIPTLLQRPAQQPRILQIRQCNTAVALEAEVHEVEVLRNNGRGGAREVEREAVFDGAEVMELEDEVLGEVGLVAPDDPAYTNICKAEFVATDGGKNRQYFLLKIL